MTDEQVDMIEKIQKSEYITASDPYEVCGVCVTCLSVGLSVCVCVWCVECECMYMCVCMCACVLAYVCACACVCKSVHQVFMQVLF